MRPSWDEYFMEMVDVVAKRSTCLRRQVGAVIVSDKRILATGYNGAPTGLKHCDKVGCLRQQLGVPSGDKLEMCRALHAEQNAIIQAALYGVSLRNSTIYTNVQPCVTCTKMIINAGIRRVVFRDKYPHEMAEGLLREAGVEVCQFVPTTSVDRTQANG
ncbi:MAG: deoxycytidylate deaminase [Chloroflexota bacterium]